MKHWVIYEVTEDPLSLTVLKVVHSERRARQEVERMEGEAAHRWNEMRAEQFWKGAPCVQMKGPEHFHGRFRYTQERA